MKKKKSNIHLKQSKAENRNKYFVSINAILKAMNLDLRVGHMSSAYQDFLYNGKTISPKLTPSEGVSTSSKLFLEIKHTLSRVMELSKAQIDNSGTEVTVKEYLTIYFDISRIATAALTGAISVTDHDRDILNKYKVEYTEQFEAVKKTVASYSKIATWYFSDFKRRICWIDYNFKTIIKDAASPLFNWVYHEKQVESKKFLKDRYNRIAYKFYRVMPEREPEKITVNPSLLNSKHHEELEIYIQDHVYTRLLQRLDTIDEVIINIELVKSLKNFEVVQNKHGARFIVFKFLDKRIGYLTYRIINNEILLTTFLFLTHDNTPEGEKLKALTGLNKTDIKYLQIDKLSAFSNSDLRNNSELYRLFQKAGCEHLFCKDLKLTKSERKKKSIANFMLEYLNKQ